MSKPRQPARFPRSLLAGLAVALAAFSSSTMASAVGGPTTHLVRPGETLGAISQVYGVSLGHLAELNRIEDPDRIRAGQQLRLPESRADAASPAQDRVHMVRPGDTLSGLAAAYAVSIQALAELNGLPNPDQLRPGQRLRVPAAAPAASRPTSLQTQLSQAIAERRWQNARVGVAAHHLASGERVQLRANEIFPAASLMKLPIMVELYRQLGTAQRQPSPFQRSLLEAMIVHSENQAANRLLDVVGRESVNRTLADLGLASTVLRNPFADGQTASTTTRFNQTSASDIAALFELLAAGRPVSPEASRAMLALLERVEDSSKLKRELPSGVRVAHKSGWFDGVSNDAGLVFSPRGTYAIAVLAQGSFDTEAGNQMIASLSRIVYDAWGR